VKRSVEDSKYGGEGSEAGNPDDFTGLRNRPSLIMSSCRSEKNSLTSLFVLDMGEVIQVSGGGSPAWASVRKPREGAFSFWVEDLAIAFNSSIIKVSVELLFKNRQQTGRKGRWRLGNMPLFSEYGLPYGMPQQVSNLQPRDIISLLLYFEFFARQRLLEMRRLHLPGAMSIDIGIGVLQ
jgi:hypothetical protein